MVPTTDVFLRAFLEANVRSKELIHKIFRQKVKHIVFSSSLQVSMKMLTSIDGALFIFERKHQKMCVDQTLEKWYPDLPYRWGVGFLLLVTLVTGGSPLRGSQAEHRHSQTQHKREWVQVGQLFFSV